MEFKRVSLTLDLLLAVDQTDDVYLVDEAIEQLLNKLYSIQLENDNAALIIESLVQTEMIEDDEE